MIIGLVYDVKEHYGYKEIDMRYTDFHTMDDIHFAKSCIESLGHTVYNIGNKDDLIEFINDKKPVDMIFNMSWGYKGRNREGLVPAILEANNIKYSGSDSFACSLCLDKIHTKLAARYLDIKTPDFFIAYTDNVPPKLAFPMVLKPNAQGTGMGVTIVKNEAEYYKTLNELLCEYGSPVLCEEYIDGVDVTVPILVNQAGSYALNIMSILDFKQNPLTIYDAKIKSSRKCSRVVYNGVGEIQKSLIADSCKIFEFIGCCDFGRADFRVTTDGKTYFLEIAPLPSLAKSGSFCKCAELTNLNYADVFKHIINSTINRYKH